MASIDDVLNLPQRRILMPQRNMLMDQHEQIINKFFDDFLGNRKNFIENLFMLIHDQITLWH